MESLNHHGGSSFLGVFVVKLYLFEMCVSHGIVVFSLYDHTRSPALLCLRNVFVTKAGASLRQPVASGTVTP